MRVTPPSRASPLTHLLASLRVIAAVIKSPSLRRVELAFFLFNAVEFGTWVAILLYAYEATGPASLGLVVIAQLIPAALSAPFAALLADRPQRTHALAAGYVIQALAFGATGACMVLGLPPLIVYVSAAIAACTIGFTRPTQGALLPELSRTPEELSVANGVSGTVEGAGLFIGPLAAAAILAVGTPAAVFAVGAIVFVVAASLVVSLPPTAHPDAVEAAPSSDPAAGVPLPPSGSTSSMASACCVRMPTSGSWSRSWPFVARSSGRWTSCSSSSPSRSTGRASLAPGS